MPTILKFAPPAASPLTPELKAFIDRAIVPALLKAWAAENKNENAVAPSANVEHIATRQMVGSSIVREIRQ